MQETPPRHLRRPRRRPAIRMIIRLTALLSLPPAVAWANPVAALHRGVNLTNWFRYPASQAPSALAGYIGDLALADLRHAGFDFVRLAVDPAVVAAPTGRTALLAAIRRIQHQGLSVIVSPHPTGWHLETSASDRQALRDFWTTLSAALRPLDPARTLPEVLNEPVFAGDPAGWARLQHAVLTLIRQNLPRSTVILTGQDWGSIGGLLALTPTVDAPKADAPEADANVIYSFHFYEPTELTSLAAYRHDVDRTALAALPFPVAGACPVSAANAATRDLIRYYCALGWDEAHLRTRIDQAFVWAHAHGVHLLAGEFGATAELNPVARLTWIGAVRRILDADHIAWALWGYDDIMGFAVHRPPGRRPPLDPALLGALDLHTPM